MLIVCPSCASEYTIDAARLGPQGRRVRCAGCRESWHVQAPAEDPAAPGTEADLRASGETPPAAAAPALAEADAAPALAEADAEAASGPAAEAARPPEAPDAEPPAPEMDPPAAEPPPDPAAAAQDPLTIESRDHAVAPAGPGPRGTPRKGRAARKTRAASPAGPRRARVAALGAALAAGLACAAVLGGRDAVVSAVPEAAAVFERLGLPVNVVGLAFAEVASSMTPAVPGGGQPGVLLVEGRIENPTRREIQVPDIDIAVRGEGNELLYNWSVPAAASRLAGGEGTTFRARLSSPPPAGQRVQVTFRVEGRDVKVALR